MRRLLALVAAATLSATGVGALGAAAAAPAPPDPNKWALVVGISQYQPPTRPTFGGAGDAGAVQAALLKNGWSKDNIMMLVDDEATAPAIRKGLDWLVSKSGPTTTSFFHFSGHTKQEALGMADGDAEEYDEELWTYANEFIPDGELGQILRPLQGRGIISIAACEAAGFDDGISAPNRMVFSASREDQKAYEYAGAARSVFVELMYDQALSGGAGDTDGNRVVSLQEAFLHAAARAPLETANQQPYGPQNPVMAGGDGSQWFLQPPGAPAGSLDGLIQGLTDRLPPEIGRLVPRGLLVPQTTP